MQIQCPQCETTFHLDEEQLGESGSKVRCSRCGRVFWAEAPVGKEAPPPEEVTLEESSLPAEEELLTAFQEPPRRRGRSARRNRQLLRLHHNLLRRHPDWNTWKRWWQLWRSPVPISAVRNWPRGNC